MRGLRLRLRIGALAMLALTGVALAGCDTLARHSRSADSCDCFADITRSSTPILGHGWKI